MTNFKTMRIWASGHYKLTSAQRRFSFFHHNSGVSAREIVGNLPWKLAAVLAIVALKRFMEGEKQASAVAPESQF